MPVMKISTLVHTDQRKCWLMCPGCEDLHVIDLSPGRWEWDGNLEAPTFSPSILARSGIVCHSFVRAGQWEFLSDSQHALAGQTAPMIPLPDWLL